MESRKKVKMTRDRSEARLEWLIKKKEGKKEA
jgi:hypothetical protein